MNRAFIFPGQGSQTIGMGKDFYDNFKVAKDTFYSLDDCLNEDFTNLIFNGTAELLNQTDKTQPALMATCISILRTLLTESKKNLTDICQFVAGHSVGEYSALHAAGSIDFSTTAKLLKKRGTAMKNACGDGQGSMAACIGIKINDLENLIKDTSCEIANDNIEGQIVISGLSENIDRTIAILKDLNYKAIKLKVSGPFHSSLIKEAENEMREVLLSVNFLMPRPSLINNVTSDITKDSSQIAQNLINQICARVRWRETIDKLAMLKVEEIVEIGPGKVLNNMIKKTNHNFKLTNISNIIELEEFLKTL